MSFYGLFAYSRPTSTKLPYQHPTKTSRPMCAIHDNLSRTKQHQFCWDNPGIDLYCLCKFPEEPLYLVHQSCSGCNCIMLVSQFATCYWLQYTYINMSIHMAINIYSGPSSRDITIRRITKYIYNNPISSDDGWVDDRHSLTETRVPVCIRLSLMHPPIHSTTTSTTHLSRESASKTTIEK